MGILVGFACVILLYFKPHLAKILGPIYAVAQGFFLGAISKGYETYYDGIVVQAAGATIAVFGVMLVLYKTRHHQGHRPLPPHRDRRHASASWCSTACAS